MKSLLVTFVVIAVAVVSGNVINDNGSRILGGTTASISTYPFAASMLYELFNKLYLSANGIILTSNAILSAAHPYVNFDGSVHPTTHWKARVGSAYFSTGGTLHELSSITIHPNFNSFAGNNTNDLAVIHTTISIEFTPSIQAATLAHTHFSLPDDLLLTAVGWGVRQIGEVVIFDQMLSNGVNLLNQVACSKSLGETVTRDVICAAVGRNGNGPCTGNAGSALFLNNVVLGIFSYNRVCGVAGEPNVYVNVATYIQWISATATGTVRTTGTL